MLVDYAITVAAVRRFVVIGQREESILLDSRRWLGLPREVAEQLRAIINCAIAISIKSKPRII